MLTHHLNPMLMHISLRTRLTRQLGMLGVVLAASTFAGCNSDRAVGPQPDLSTSFAKSGSTSSSSSTVTKDGLSWKKSLKTPITRSVLVTQLNGGKLEIPELGFSMYVPSAAITTPSLTISVTALAGNIVAYEFAPHGTVFLRALIINQKLDPTTWSNFSSFRLIGAGYFKDASQINQTSGTALLDEVLVAMLTPTSVYWSVWHFSGYMVSMD